MPYRSDSQAWWNLPGVVAVYQPVRAPDPKRARYNMAHGGDNRYQAVEGVAPTWHGATGWTFDGATQVLNTQVEPGNYWSIFLRVTDVPNVNAYRTGIGQRRGSSGTDGLMIRVNNQLNAHAYIYQAYAPVGNYVASGVYAIAGTSGYLDGAVETAALNGTGVNPIPIAIGANNQPSSDHGWTPAEYTAGTVRAAAIYSRVLSAAEVWLVTQQMKYCDVNPEWSAWGRRRRYYYAPPQGATLAGDMALGVTRTMTPVRSVTTTGTTSLAMTRGVAQSGEASALAAISLDLARMVGAAPSRTSYGAVTLAIARAISAVAMGAYSGAVQLAIARALSINGGLDADAALLLGMVRGIAANGGQEVTAALTLAIRRELELIGLSNAALVAEFAATRLVATITATGLTVEVRR